MMVDSQYQRAQKRRDREVLRYLPKIDWESAAHTHTQDKVDNGLSGRSHAPVSSIDRSLNAFAQLGALRLQARRAMISLITRDTQYIIAESTQTLSSQSDDIYQSGDSLSMGVRKIPRNEGICGHALACGSRRNPENVIRKVEDVDRVRVTVYHDIAQEDQLKQNPMAAKTSFYVGVPIRSKHGYIIGSYSVLDDAPRSEISEQHLRFLQDISATVMEHLEFMAIKDDHERATMMVKALGLFVEGQSSISDWWLRTSHNEEEEAMTSSTANSEYTGQSDIDREPESSRDTDDSLRRSSDPAPTAADDPTPQIISPKPMYNTTENMMERLDLHSGKADTQSNGGGALKKPNTTPSPTPTEKKSPSGIRTVFSRASNLLRESTGVDGAIFFEANVSGFGTMREDGHGRKQIGGKRKDSSEEDTNETSSSGTGNSTNSKAPHNPTPKRYCDVLGFSTASSSSLHGHEPSDSHLAVADDFIKKLLRRYPHGKIFAFDEDGAVSSTDEDAGRCLILAKGRQEHGSPRRSDATSILEIFPGSRFIMILPLWDSIRERWYASSILWTSDPTRVLTLQDDLTYLASFSNNIMAEVSRLETVAADHAKSTFISSISHELRSPLHGVMGSLELLHETILTSFQMEAMDAIRQCSTTLLDTLNHLLDYAKINNFTTGKRKELKLTKLQIRSRKALPAEEKAVYGAISRASDLSLDIITEEVVQAIASGHRQAHLFMPTHLVDEQPTSDVSSTVYKPVIVILDIDWTSRWRFYAQSGAWRRIVMNLFANALKYTTAGYVSVRLECHETLKTKYRLNQSTIVLTVTDSGKGVSTDFIERRIFTPFAQEDSLSPGTGLGLSIVRQIVESLHGRIDFQSTLGSGTSIKVTLPLERVTFVNGTTTGLSAIDNDVVNRAKAFVQGKRLGIVFAEEVNRTGTQDPEADDQKEALVLLRSALMKMAKQCFDVEIVSGTNFEHTKADVYITTQEAFKKTTEDSAQNLLPGSEGQLPLIQITSSVLPTEQPRPDLPLAYLSHPITPNKLANAFLSIYKDCTNTIKGLQSGISKNVYTNGLHINSPSLQEESVKPIPPSISPTPLLSTFRSASSHTSSPSSSPAPRPHLLIVDDNIINLKLLSTFIRKLSYPFATAADGSLALSYYRSCPLTSKPAVIFMDISMPVMDGFTAARLIRAHEKEEGLAACTIVALTGLASAEAQTESYNSGINLFISKPVPMVDIKRVLQSLQP